MHCERAIGADALKTLVIHEEDMQPDWSRGVLYFDENSDGVYEEYKVSEHQKYIEPLLIFMLNNVKKSDCRKDKIGFFLLGINYYLNEPLIHHQ